MKKISQAIIGATLILDVAVVFTFGLAVISSFEDGSRLPETTFVRKTAEGRVAGTMTANTLSTAHIYLNYPATSGEIFSGLKILKAKTSSDVYSVKFIVTQNSNNATGDMMATRIPGTILEWSKEIDTAQMPNEPHSIIAKAFSMSGTLLATSQTITVNVLNDNTTASSGTVTIPTAVITSPIADGVIISEPSFVVGGDFNASAGVLAKSGGLHILKTDEFNAIANPIIAANNPIGSNHWESIFSTDQLANGDYDLMLKIVYADSLGIDRVAASSPRRVKILKTITSTNTSYNQNANSNTNTSSGVNYNSNTSSANTSTANANTSTSGTNTNSAISTNNNTSIGTITPPPTGTTTTTLTVTMIDPTPATILRSRDNPLAAKTSAAVSDLKFIIHKSDEPIDWITPIDAVSSDKINWTGKFDLTDFKDGTYDIKAVSGDIKSKPVNVIVQKFSFKWLTPNKGDELSKKAALRAEVNGIYGIDGKTPMNDVVVEFWQTGVASSYPPKYVGRAQKKPDSHEWFYEWNTIDSPLGECRLEVRIGNAAYNTTKGSLYNTDPLSVKVLNQISSASLSGLLNSNANQNSNAPSFANSNTANANKAANNAINSSTNLNQNVNTAAGSNSNLNLAQDSLNINSSTGDAVSTQTDSDNDKLSDEKEAQSGTNPNSNDTDGDGLFDREEAEVHGTNPLKNDTDGDGYNDFEEIQSGHDPLKPPTDPSATVLLKPKPIEEPKNTEKPILKSLVVEKIENKPLPDTNTPEPEAENIIVLKGKGPANTILTLFIYSNDPIVVTVRTNENGEWIYELDKTLEDGEHEVYATITDDTGKIESTSSPMRFLVKQAQAETIPERADIGASNIPGSSSTNIYLLISGIMVFIAIVAGFIIALRRKRGDAN